MADEEDDVVEDEQIEASLIEVRVPEFVWEHSLRSLGHDVLADRLDKEEYGNGYMLVLTADFQISQYDLLWYATAKHLVLQDEEIEFLSMKDMLAIETGSMQDTDARHVFIEGFAHDGRRSPLSAGSEHTVRQKIREWIMGDVCVYPYIQGTMETVQEWWGNDFKTYLLVNLNDYFSNE